MFISDIAAGLVSMRYNAKGPNYATVSACASSAHAIGDAYRIIQYGDADIMITGGSEAAITPMAVGGFANMKALSERNDARDGVAPVRRDRDGFVMGDGGGIVVLEELEHARARGATIYAEIAGYGATADAYHITAPAPDGDGAQRAMRLAMKDAGVSPADIDYINAHGTSTPPNDSTETKAVKAVFGDTRKSLIVGSTKSMTGHMLGAAGAVEFIFGALAVRDGIVPPTINSAHSRSRVRSRLHAEHGREQRSQRRAQQLLRVRRAQRHARGQALRGVAACRRPRSSTGD